jgi:hypothetical protein
MNMEPRSEERGKIQIVQDLTEDGAASMGPRSEERGIGPLSGPKSFPKARTDGGTASFVDILISKVHDVYVMNCILSDFPINFLGMVAIA